jgi:hypothetical protein
MRSIIIVPLVFGLLFVGRQGFGQVASVTDEAQKSIVYISFVVIERFPSEMNRGGFPNRACP